MSMAKPLLTLEDRLPLSSVHMPGLFTCIMHQTTTAVSNSKVSCPNARHVSLAHAVNQTESTMDLDAAHHWQISPDLTIECIVQSKHTAYPASLRPCCDTPLPCLQDYGSHKGRPDVTMFTMSCRRHVQHGQAPLQQCNTGPYQRRNVVSWCL